MRSSATPLTKTGSIASRVASYVAALSIGAKLRLASMCSVGGLTIMLLAIAIGGKVALDLRSQRMAVSESVVAAAELARAIDAARLATYRMADGRGESLRTIATHELAIARRHMAELETLTTRVAPDMLPQVEQLRSAISQFDAESAKTTQLRYRSAASTEAAFAIGEQLAARTNRLDVQLRDRGQVLDVLAKERIVGLFTAFGALFLFTVAVILFTARVLARDISEGLLGLIGAARSFAAGETVAIVPGIERSDEIGELARAVDTARAGADRIKHLSNERKTLRDEREGALMKLAEHFERTVGDVVGGVAAASSQLQSTASAMAAAAEQASAQSGMVSQSMDRASSGVTAAAAASDEFAMSIGEISRQATSSAELARRATDAATHADETISALAASADQVGQIVELISSIAQRTNLLALNASIEAARGGEAGR
ncbi:MAG: methyl-accepting chemotaxis protein, partial [Sphingomonadales bacterium]